MSVFTRTRKRDGAIVWYAQYRLGGRLINEKVPECELLPLPEKPSKAERKAWSDARKKKRLAAEAFDRNRRQKIVDEPDEDPREPKEKKKRLTFAALVDRFLRDYEPRSGRIDYYEHRATIWKRHLRKSDARQVSVFDVERFKKKRKADGVGPSTIRKDLASLGTLFRWALARGLVASNPADAVLVRRPPEPRHPNEHLAREEEARLLRASPLYRRRIYRWALATGMDRGEIVGGGALSWGDVDRVAGIVHAPRGKTGAKREIPLTPRLERLLDHAARAYEGEPPEGEPVFTGAKGAPLSANALSLGLRRDYEKAGLTPPRRRPFKVLRHTFASRLAMAGVEAPAIARLMGHTTLSITDTYMDLSPAALRAALEKLETSTPASTLERSGGTASKGAFPPPGVVGYHNLTLSDTKSWLVRLIRWNGSKTTTDADGASVEYGTTILEPTAGNYTNLGATTSNSATEVRLSSVVVVLDGDDDEIRPLNPVASMKGRRASIIARRD